MNKYPKKFNVGQAVEVYHHGEWEDGIYESFVPENGTHEVYINLNGDDYLWVGMDAEIQLKDNVEETQRRLGLEYKRSTEPLVIIEVSPFYEDTAHFGRVVYARMSDGTIERIRVGGADEGVFVNLPHVGDLVTIYWDYSRQTIRIHNTHRFIDSVQVFTSQKSSLITSKNVLAAWGRDPNQRHMLTMDRILSKPRIRAIALKLVSPELRHMIETALVDHDWMMAKLHDFSLTVGVDLEKIKL